MLHLLVYYVLKCFIKLSGATQALKKVIIVIGVYVCGELSTIC